jgi:hypothetical protein
MNQLRLARADDWLTMIEFQTTALNWTRTDEDRFTEMLGIYCSSGVQDEISDCTTLDEMSGLNDSLNTLLKTYGLDVGSAIRKLDEEIRERLGDDDEDEAPEAYDYYNRGSPGGRGIVSPEVISDDAVSQMFNTLRNSSLL